MRLLVKQIFNTLFFWSDGSLVIFLLMDLTRKYSFIEINDSNKIKIIIEITLKRKIYEKNLPKFILNEIESLSWASIIEK